MTSKTNNIGRLRDSIWGRLWVRQDRRLWDRLDVSLWGRLDVRLNVRLNDKLTYDE
ncbi:MAG: hypothetical protein WC455_10425 [Dehalococcoidia bacterium]|jgi:hypothetical protein